MKISRQLILILIGIDTVYMSKYNIKSYQESFLEAQEKVGIEATKEWRAFGQTPAAMLKTLYSRPGFDPETKQYAFEGDKLVGFITSGITWSASSSVIFRI